MKLGVCVPYRNREEHLAKFSPHVHEFLKKRGIDHKIYFAHQCDDKLFNRGKMKNIAADIAFKDGCDYIVWHDIDMLPEDDSCDYSYNPDTPKHLAVRISQSDYNLKYEEYFGGAVLFTKEQVMKTNGYSNDYWDWGMEDDDLFWRCVVNGYADQKYLHDKYVQKVLHFNGKNSSVEIPVSRNIRGLCSRSHTVSILVKAEQQLDKAPLYLIGDDERRFVEYPIIRRPGYDWGLSYNNSRAYTTMLWNYEKEFLYMWMKRYEEQWTWVTLTVDDETKEIRLYLNGKESDSRFGTGVPSPLKYNGLLKRYASEPYILGTTNSLADSHPAKWFKGSIAKVAMWDRCLSEEEIQQSILGEPIKEDLQLYYDFAKSRFGLINDLSGNDNYGNIFNITEIEDEIAIPYTILPHRRDGKFFCLPHQTEGLIQIDGVDKWAKGETTARNERRYVLQMQQGEWDWKNDGMNNLTYELLSIEDIGNNSVIINCKC
jgi:hypothetical protein